MRKFELTLVIIVRTYDAHPLVARRYDLDNFKIAGVLACRVIEGRYEQAGKRVDFVFISRGHKICNGQRRLIAQTIVEIHTVCRIDLCAEAFAVLRTSDRRIAAIFSLRVTLLGSMVFAVRIHPAV